jgi:hypothetical protein
LSVVTDELLVGVVSSSERVEARLVEWTPFGRLRASRRRLVEDVMSPPGFTPAPVQRQLARGAAAPGEEQAAESWLQSVASAVEQLLFGLRAPGVRIGVALDAWLDGRGRDVLAARGGPRVRGWGDRLTNTLRARGVQLVEPVRSVSSLARAAGLGEVWSPLGSMAGGVGGLVTCWDVDLSWAEVAGGQVVREGRELPGGPLDRGAAALREHWSAEGGSARELERALGRGGAAVQGWLVQAAGVIGEASGRRLLERLHRATDQPTGRGTPSGSDGLVVTGCLGRSLEDPQVARSLEEGLALRLSEREDASMSAGWIEREDGEVLPCRGLVRHGQGDRGLVVGAAAASLEGRLPEDVRRAGGREEG